MENLLEVIYNNVVATISLAIACISAFAALRSNMISKRVLRIQEKEQMGKGSNFEIYLVDSFRWKDHSGKESNYLLFNIMISNNSSIRNSFKATLVIDYIRHDNSTNSVILRHQSKLINNLSELELEAFPDDIEIDEKSSHSKWLIFNEPRDYFQKLILEKCTIKIIDISGMAQEADIYLLKTHNRK